MNKEKLEVEGFVIAKTVLQNISKIMNQRKTINNAMRFNSFMLW